MSHSHKPGTLKQANKKHKGAASKREVKRGLGPGKTESIRGNATLKQRSTSNMAMEARNKRMSRDINAKRSDRMQQWLDKRIGSVTGTGGHKQPYNSAIPKIVVFVPLSPAAASVNIPRSLILDDHGISANISVNSTGIVSDVPLPLDSCRHVHHSVTYQGKSAMKCTYIQPHFNLSSVLEAVKVSDIVVYVMHAPSYDMCNDASYNQTDKESQFIDALGYDFITAVKAIGTPISAACFVNLPLLSGPATSVTTKLRQHHHTMKLLGIRMANSFLYKDIKTLEYNVNTSQSMDDVNVNTSGHNNQLLRFIHETLVNSSESRMVWRVNRSYLLIDSVYTKPSTVTAAESEDRVYIRGYIRNKPLAVNSLMHVVGVGTGAVVSIKAVTPGTHDYPVECSTLLADESLQDSLEMLASPDILQGEQTWPMDDEIDEDYDDAQQGQGALANSTNTAGVNGDGYHDEWFEEEPAHEDDGDDVDAGLNDDTKSIMGGGQRLKKSYSLINQNTKAKTLEESELQFPDEVDSPELPNTVRSQFVHYRALQSFRHSDWHPKENLPQDYSQIFQFQQFSVTQRQELNEVRSVASLQDSHLCKQYTGAAGAAGGRKASLSMSMDCEEDVEGPMNTNEDANTVTHPLCVPNTEEQYVMSNIYVEIELKGLDAKKACQLHTQQSHCSYGYSLLKHEHKLSVCHINLTTLPVYEELYGSNPSTTTNTQGVGLIKGKTPLVYQIGFRTPYVTKALFSEGNLNCDKHKMTRYLEPGKYSTATIYAPITYLTCPVLVYAPDPRKSHESLPLDVHGNIDVNELVLIATGSLDSIDPDKIILKKAILTGVPIRVKKRFGVVKYMFNEPTDVKYYMPAELATKHGLRGHIREPVGTHGLFKAIFNAPIKQNDTIMLILYKRVFPKFYLNDASTVTGNSSNSNSSRMVQKME